MRTLRPVVRSVKIGYTVMDGKMPTKRKYELKQRAEEMAETRRRITEAAVDLHRTVGPARTTLSAIAKRAGVQRHTVYRHFPTETELFGACSAHYFTANPWPDCPVQVDGRLSDPPPGLEHLVGALLQLVLTLGGHFRVRHCVTNLDRSYQRAV